MSIASRTSSRTSPHQSRAPPPADVFLENWTVAAGQRRVRMGTATRVSRARCRVHVCVVSNKNHASNSRPHARNTSNTKITSTRLVTRVTRSTRTRARRAAARTNSNRLQGDASNLIRHRCPQCFSIRALLAIGDSTGSSAGGLYGYSRRAWLYAKTPPMQTAVPSADRYVTAFPK